MSTDAIHGTSILIATASLCVGAHIVAGIGAAMILFGGILLSGVIYSRTRSANDVRDTE